MRVIFATLALVSAAAAAFAGASELRISTGAQSHGSATSASIRGRVVEVLIDSPADSTTGTVSVVAARAIPTMADLTLVSNTISNDFVARPALDNTDSAGAALTSDPPEHPYLYGETVTFAVTNASATNLEWRCIIKTEGN